MSDATKTILEVPRSATNLPEESKEVMVVKDQTGRKWKFEVAIKDDEKQKRLQGEWSQFTKAHGLMKAQRKQKGPEAAARLLLPTVTPLTKCKLRLLKLERIKDYLLMEEEFVTNQERLKPQEEKTEEDRSKVDDLRGSPMSVGNLEELIDENHAIVSSSVGPEYYVGILSFVDKDQLEPGCAILMHNKVLSVVGLLQDEVDSMVSVMKVEKAPLESYADIGGLDAQIQEIKEAVELPLTHPELSEKVKLVSMGLSGGRLR
ncbi:26S proteasome regulatory subunit 4 homolog B-like [Camellia sinensis]|uniref:26S proteasome regulatory subunit 4 homolog B-like n=1 Tax=Camellia sinensis TaxID=4442 RepID=UPI0010358977|nr:26S proteasome regulatory subunit 4 homolog B-like [Camellia sinensis]